MVMVEIDWWLFGFVMGEDEIEGEKLICDGGG